MNLKIGIFLQNGKYRIAQELGHGGFGVTYLAYQVNLERRVAIKEFFMKEYCVRDESTSHVRVTTEHNRELVSRFRNKFVKEARCIANLSHPHIVRVIDVFEENGTAYYVMDYLGGGTLQDAVQAHGAFSVSVASDYIRQVATALDYIHGRNLLHLDVKPSNIMLNDSGAAVLVDFGVSKRYDESGRQTSSTPLGVSEGYAPIEQYESGGMDQFSPSTDIYSLGATFYYLLTGVRPPKASALLSESLSFPDGIPDGIRACTVCAMAPGRKDRPQSVGEFLRLLGTAVGGSGRKLVKDEDTVLDASLVEPEVSKPGEISDSGRMSLRKWFVPIVVCLFVGLCVYVFGERKSASSYAQNDVLASVEEQTSSKTEDTSFASPEPSPCLFYVKTSPSGAEIMVDGQSYGKSPIEGVKIPVGNHDIRITLSGYESISEKINFSNHPIVLNEILKAKKSAEKVTSIYTYKSGSINGHDYVDLGLSVKWATCNVGASRPEDYGNYYAWGEIKTKAVHNSKTYTLNHDIFKKGDDFSGNPKYDVARAKWGNSWRMHTKNEANELLNKCTWKYIKSSTLAGYEVKGPNGNVIFLPIAGMKWRNEKVELRNEFSSYWTSTAGRSSWTACVLHLRDSETIVYDGIQELGPWNDRENGMSVRPVSN